MGQYHTVYNVDKKELISAHAINNGAKLMEQIGWEKSTASALFLLIANSNGRGGGDANEHPLIGRWAGDRIVLQGDYAEAGDQAFVNPEDQEAFINISSNVKAMLDAVFGED